MGGKEQKVSLVDTAMGTILQGSVYVEGDRSQGEEILRDTFELVRSLEENLLSRRLETSEVWRIDESAHGTEGAEISKELADLLERCAAMTVDSQGAFDVSIGRLVALWRVDELAAQGAEEGAALVTKAPDESELQSAMDECGMEYVAVENGRIYLKNNVTLDLGSVGKGFALDRIAESLRSGEIGITGGIFSLGGSILTYGQKPDGMAWKVGVTDPKDPGKVLGYLSFTGDYCISTSGDYERYFEVEGVRYHHILDPKTGYPAENGIHGVTIFSKSGFLSDALSTACFVLGKEKGMALAEKYGAEALFVGEDDQIYMSEGMKAMFTAR
ncbi:MAG: FAD:protein FMN transferase [Lachnospiraceae bacterium]|nr:FAD:protein FMN transferase [Lachnospiraceae bacterium]